MWRTWCHRTDGLIALDHVGRVGDHGASGGGTTDCDVGDGRWRVYQRAARTGVKHNHGRTRTRDAHARPDTTAARGAHGTRTAVAAGIPAGTLGLLATIMHVVATTAASFSPMSYFIDVFVVVLAGRCARVAALVRRRRAQVFVRSGAGAAVTTVHLHLNCGNEKNRCGQWRERASRSGQRRDRQPVARLGRVAAATRPWRPPQQSHRARRERRENVNDHDGTEQDGRRPKCRIFSYLYRRTPLYGG